MDLTHEDIRAKCPRFRVLVMGRRNAGKTTILRRMAGAEDDERYEVRDRHGELINNQMSLLPTAERGLSDIDNEITFPSNPLFVFHDSRGIESGAETDDDNKLCLNHVREFIIRKARSEHFRDRIHAIWFCMPVDTPRVPSETFELKFLDMDISDVPLIAVFTKFESMVDAAYETLKLTHGRSEAKKNARVEAEQIFENTVCKAVQATIHPPSRCIKLQYMDKSNADCSSLSLATAETLEDGALVTLFAKAQASSGMLGCAHAMKALLRVTISEKMRATITKNKASLVSWVMRKVIGYCPFWWLNAYYDWTTYDWYMTAVRMTTDDRMYKSMQSIIDKVVEMVPQALIFMWTTRDLLVVGTVCLVIGIKTGMLSKQPWSALPHMLPLVTKELVEDIIDRVGAILKKTKEGVQLEDELAYMVMDFANQL